jgi:hypothetical protein
MKKSEPRQAYCFDPPADLSSASQAFWRRVVPRRARSTEKLLAVREALRTLDRAEQARLALGNAELTTKTLASGRLHIHPLVVFEAEQRELFQKQWARLGLDGGSIDNMMDGYWQKQPDALGLPT